MNWDQMGQKIQDAFSPTMAEKFEQVLHTTQQTGQINNFEYHLMISDRVHWFDARLVPLSAAQFIFTARDITKCKENEQRMKQHMQQLSVLRSIDLAIASGLDLNLLLSMLLDQLTGLLHVDAVSILLLNSRNEHSGIFARAGAFVPNMLAIYPSKTGGGLCRAGGTGAQDDQYARSCTEIEWILAVRHSVSN